MTPITGETLRFLTNDKTHVIERNGGQAFVYLAHDGTGHMRLDDGVTRAGTWRLTDDGYSTEWDGGQTGEWQLLETDRGMDYVSRDGGVQLKMLGVMFGDPEGLAG